ncbi:Twin-arginine translocation pathway signal [Bordetella tumbae]|uniref:Bug family tripartite tricarboxylate transporter substrate binding protein n=1 Tax=Bordetella tumbae TaxID=1649139 RepID=UPI0039EFBB02
MKRSTLACGIALALAVSSAYSAYPDHPVRLIVGFSAGGPTDVVARAFADQATRTLGQTFIVENKPGANTTLAAKAVASAKPDGYTLLLGATNHTMIPALYSEKIGFDALKSFAPVCTLAISPTVLVVGPSMPVKTVGEFLQQLKAEPGMRTYATPGTGSSGHFASAQFLKLTGTSMNHIPYKGAAQAVTDLLGGQVDSSFATLGSVLPQLQGGKLHAIAVASPSRSPFLPDVPTFAEAGVKDYSADAWYGLLAPAGTPADVLAALEKVATEFSKSPESASKLQSLGMQAQNTCGEKFGTQLSQEVTNYTDMARELGLKSE